jgi:hypothetical protein
LPFERAPNQRQALFSLESRVQFILARDKVPRTRSVSKMKARRREAAFTTVSATYRDY